MQRRTLQKEVAKMPPLPKSEPPLNDPPYEVIEFPSQQYSNTALLFGNKTAQNKKEEVNRKCDLCGSTNAQYHCEMCAQQAFCVSCDQMYHRHPKRQHHIRKRLQSVPAKGKGFGQPPIPPKGESLMAPIPPPRRNKRATKSVPGTQPESLKKNGSIMGSLKRFVGGIQPVSSPFQPKTTVTRNDSRPPKFSHSLHSGEFDPQSIRRNGGYLGWELQDRHRSGSFAALNGPGFSPMMQAQSMAQLNCPSCHHHGGAGNVGVSGWDWNRSQMNLNAPFQQAWPGMSAPGTWHGSIMFPPAYRIPAPDNFSDHSSSRRGSIRHQRYNRRRPSKFDNEDDSESDVSLSDDRKSRRGVSPALSRRSRRTLASDSEDDTTSRKSDRRFKRRVPMSRDPSPAVFRPPKGVGYRSKKPDDDDAISMKSSCSRKSHKSAYLKKTTGRSSSSDSDDELTSERDGLNDAAKNATPSDSADNDDDHIPPPVRVQSPKQIGKMSHITKAASKLKTQVAERVKNYEKMQFKKTPLKGSAGKEAKPSQDAQSEEEEDDWECEHCTYLNPASARVCDVCCKSKKKPVVTETKSPTEQMVESMKALEVSSADTTATNVAASHKKKDDESNTDNKETVSAATTKTSTGTSPPPQSASTQTYDIPSEVTKRNRSLSFDDYSDWNPNKKSSSAASFTSDTNQSLSLQSKQELSPESSQSPVFMDAVLHKQMKDSLEIVKLLKDAEKHQFTPDDLTVALMHCGESNPVKWLLENWSQMIDTVVTLATNFGHEQPENTIGTISSHEAKSALYLHNGDIWAAATECIRQRQRKYVKLMAQGNFTREDVVTVLTANHGDIEAAYMELRKSQLKPFLMKIWGPPQGLDNDCGNTFRLHDAEKFLTCEPKTYSSLPKTATNGAQNDFSFVHSWLQTVNAANAEDTEVEFAKLKNNLKQHASSFYLNTDLDRGSSLVSEEYSDSNDELYLTSIPKNPYLRYRSCENLNKQRPPVTSKPFHRSSECLFYTKTRSEPLAEFFLPRLARCGSQTSDIDFMRRLYDDHRVQESQDYPNFSIESNTDEVDYLKKTADHETRRGSSLEEHFVETDSLEGSQSSENCSEKTRKQPSNINEVAEIAPKVVVPLSPASIKTEEVVVSPALAIVTSPASEPAVILQTASEISNRIGGNSIKKLEESKNPASKPAVIPQTASEISNRIGGNSIKKLEESKNPASESAVIPQTASEIFNRIGGNSIKKLEESKSPASEPAVIPQTASEIFNRIGGNSIKKLEESKNPASEPAVIPQTASEISNRIGENSIKKLEESKNYSLFFELRALYELAKLNLEFLIISNNDASVQVENSAFPAVQLTNEPVYEGTGLQRQPESDPVVSENDPQIPKNFLSKAYIEISSSSSFIEDKYPKKNSETRASASDDLKIFEEDLQSDSDDNFEDVDNEESTRSIFISENSSDDEQSFVEEEEIEEEVEVFEEEIEVEAESESEVEEEEDEEEEKEKEEEGAEEAEAEENKRIGKVFHEALAENIKEYIEREAARNKPEPPAVVEHIEPVKPVLLNPPIKPIHIIRINVPDDLVSSTKLTNPDTQFEIPVSTFHSDIDNDHTSNLEKNRKPPETAVIKNQIKEKEAQQDEVPPPENSPPENSNKNNFSEYIREVIITQREDSFDEEITEEHQLQTESSNGQDAYETDASESSSKLKKYPDIGGEDDFNAEVVAEQGQRQNEPERDGYLSDASEKSFNVEVENCLSEGLSNYDQAVLAAQLIQLKFDRSQSLEAASECSTIQAAITFLQQDCQLCAEKVSIKQMISMLECEHRCCQSCAEQFFSLQILEKSIVDCVCPFCKKPKISNLDSDEVSLYFSNLDILLKSILQPNVHELFQQKLRDRTLMQDPNFKWCIECSSGFIADPDQRRVFCPDCKSVSCAQCGKLWDKEHDGKTCEQYNSWLSKNNLGSQLSRYLEDFGVTCPKCDTKFILVKGGCMHLTCSNCKYEFCSDCMKPFAMGTDCKVSEYCTKLGLHAHHPRNCLFYLRDKEPQELKQLLKENNIPLDLEPKENARCDIPLQKETEEGLIDTRCGARVEEAGLCRTHYIEYLTALIRKNKIDPIVIFDLAEILQEFRRRGKSLPIRAAKMLEYEYRRSCIEVIKEEMPLE